MKRPNILRQNLGLLVAFDALVTEGNATKAAERLSLGQPAVSHLLGRLREIFNDRLFDRTRDGLVPTRRARELHAKLVPHLKGLEALFVQDNSFDPVSTERVFRLVVSDMVQVYFIPGLLRAVESASRGISFVTVPIDSDLVTEHIERDEIDLAINHCPDPQPWIRTCPLFDVEYMCWYNPAFGEAPDTIEKFMARPQVSVTYRGATASPVADALHKQGLTRKVSIGTFTYLAAAAIAARSDAIVVGPAGIYQKAFREKGLEGCPPPFAVDKLPMSLVWHERWDNDPGSKWIRSLLVDVNDQLHREVNAWPTAASAAETAVS